MRAWSKLSLAAFALLGAPAVAQQAIAVDDPIALFERVSLADQVRLDARAFESVRHGDLPEPVRKALGFALPAGSMASLTPGVLSDSDVPNRILVQVPRKEAYLLLPEPGAKGRAASVCAVLFRGSHYAKAVAAVGRFAKIPDEAARVLADTGTGINYMQLQSGGVVAGAAEFGGWTVLRAAPEPVQQ